MFWNRRARKLKEEYSKNPHLETADTLSELVKKCPSCNNGFAGHEFSRCATWPIRKADPELQKFFETLISHEWERLGSFHDWSTDGDNAEVYVLRCPATSISIVAIKAHLGRLLGNRLLHREALTDPQGKELLAAFPALEWHTFR